MLKRTLPVLLALALPLVLAAGANANVITGTVTTAAGKPIAGLKVDALERLVSGGNAVRASTTTSASGSYSIGGLAPGKYVVRFPGSTTFMREYYDDVATYRDAALLNVSAGGTISGIDAVLQPWPRVKGRLTSEPSGEPIAGARVSVDGNPESGSATTGPDGRYTLTINDEQATDTSYKLRFDDPSGMHLPEWHADKPDQASADTVTLLPGTVTAIDAALALGGRISGSVVGEDGTAFEEEVTLRAPGGGGRIIDFRTRADGAYTSPAVPAGSYVVQLGGTSFSFGEYYDDVASFGQATAVPVTAGAITSGIDASLARWGRISGTLSDANGKPLGWPAEVTAHLPDGTRVGPVGGGTTSYSIDRLPPGSYRVRFDFSRSGGAVRWYDLEPTLASSDPVGVVGAQTTSGIDASLASGGRIAGTVIGPDGAPNGHAPVEIFDVDGSQAGDVNTDANGNYSFAGLAPGSYRVFFRPRHDSAGLPEYYENEQTLAAADPVVVSDGNTTDVDAQLSLGNRLVGTITRTDGAPVYPATVYVDRIDGEGAKSARTNAKGVYRMLGVTPGTYRVWFQAPHTDGDVGGGPDVGYLESEYYDNKQHAADATPVDLTQPTTTINARLTSTGTVRGTVRNDDGVALTGAQVYLIREDGRRAGPFTTGWKGTYEAKLLRPGKWKVFFKSPYAAYASEYYDNQATLAGADPVTVDERTTVTHVDASLTRLPSPAFSAELGQPFVAGTS